MVRDRRLVLIVLPVLSAASYLWLDRPLALALHPIPDGLMRVLDAITELGEATWYLSAGLVAGLAFRYLWRRPVYARAAWLVFWSVAVSGILTNILKFVVGRSRPYNYLRTGEYGFAPLKIDYAYNGFPSGHTATVAAVVLSLSLAFPRWRRLFYAAGAVVVSTRVLMDHHFLSDVLMGAMLATAVTWSIAHRFSGLEKPGRP